MIPPSKRELLSMLVAAGWGALLGVLPGAQFISPLFGPPAAFLLLRSRPLLSWQIPLIASALSMGVKEHDPNDPGSMLGTVLVFGFIFWTVISLLSVPWPYIFQRRVQRDQHKPTLSKTAMVSLGVGFLIFLGCGLILLGFALCLWPMPQSDGNQSLINQSLGFLLATTGMGLAFYICQNTEELNLNYEVDSLFGWILGPIAITTCAGLLFDLFRPSSSCAPSSSDCTQFGPPLASILYSVAVLEAVVMLIWLLFRGKMNRKNAPTRGGA